MGTFLSKFDAFADPVSLTFKGSRGHSTSIGGIASLITGISLIAYTIWRIMYVFNNGRDEYMFS